MDTQGPEATVLNLNQRNPNFVYGVLGDPQDDPRTHSQLERILQGTDTTTNPTPAQLQYLVETHGIVQSFLGASDAVARGESAFLQDSEWVINNPTIYLTAGREAANPSQPLPKELQNIPDATFMFAQDDYLTSIDKVLPLNCASEPLQLTEERGGDFFMEGTVYVAKTNTLKMIKSK